MKQLGMVVCVLFLGTSFCTAQEAVMSTPGMEQAVQPMPSSDGQVYADGAVMESQPVGSSCGCGGGAIVDAPAVDCDCCAAPATYYYSGYCGGCGSCGCGRMYGFRPMFGGFFGRSRCGCCY